jgi:uncharacterized protein YdgA (DUF945 family)
MRMRKIVLYVGLLAIIVGGGPYFTGYLVETKFKDVAKVLSGIDSVDIEVVKYERGWRKSFAQTRITFSGEYPHAAIDSMYGLTPDEKNELKNVGFSILMDYDIHHGPFVQTKDGDWKNWRFALATFHSNVELTGRAKDFLEKTLGQTKLSEISGEMSIEGAVQVNFEGLPLKFSEGDLGTVVWKGTHGSWSLSRDMKQFQAELMFPGLTVQSGGKSVNVEDVVARYDLHKTPEDLWLGKITGKIQNMMVSDPQNPTNDVSLTSLAMGSVSDSVSGMLEGSCTLTVEKIKMLSHDYGPFNLVVSIKNFDAMFWKAMVEFSKKARTTSVSQGQGMLLQEFMSKVPDLLKNRPVFTVDNISLKTSDGELKGFFNFAIGGPDAKDINNTAQIIQSIAAKANAMLPKSLLLNVLTQENIQTAEAANAAAHQANQPEMSADEIKQKSAEKAQEMISGALKDGYIIEKDNDYTTELEFVEGQLKVNGKSMQMPHNPTASPAVPSGQPPSVTPVPGTTSSVQ